MSIESNPGYVPGFRESMNFRELGGLRMRDGRTVKHGLLYRSAALGDMNDEELQRVHDLGIKLVFDLRCQEEADELPDPQVPGAGYVRISGCIDADDNEVNLSPKSIYRLLVNPRRKDSDPEESIEAAVAEIYSSLAFDNKAYRRLFARLENGTVPLLFHCTSGKDRTGIASMIILMALGADDETMVADYVLSNEYHRAAIEERLKDSPLLSRIGTVSRVLTAVEGVLPHFGERVLDEIRQEYGTYRIYLRREFGLDDERIEALRNRYLE